MRLTGTVAIVTGSSRGIGRVIAERLGVGGTRVLVNARAERAAAEWVVTALRAGGADASAAHGHVTDAGYVRGLVDTAQREFGGIDIVLGNVGGHASRRTLTPPLRCCARRLIGSMTAVRIVVESSGVAATHRRGTGLSAASNVAGEELMRVPAKEFGSPVRGGLSYSRRLLSPGRIGQPQDVADVVAFLAGQGKFAGAPAGHRTPAAACPA